MKLVLMIISMVYAGFVPAQTKYESGMAKGLEQMKTAATPDQMIAASAFFERIAEAEKDKWQPYYYAAYSNIIAAWMNPKSDKDKSAEKSKDLISKADAISPNNSELYCLRQMVAIQQMTVDAMARFQTYGAEINNSIAKAKQADPNNPRAYLLDAQYWQKVPAAYGGGNAKAKQLVEKALELYKTTKPASPFDPAWGKEDAEKLLASCQ